MASDYGLNFGFRRSDESMATREGRFKTPAAGAELILGTAVEIDAAEAGYMKQSASDAVPISGLRGLLVQEENHIPELFDVPGHDSYDLGAAKVDQLSVIWAGVGTKIWLRNTPAYARGTRTKAAVQMVVPTSVVVGCGLAWNGTRWKFVAANDDTAFMHVTAKSGSTTTDLYVEAVLGF